MYDELAAEARAQGAPARRRVRHLGRRVDAALQPAPRTSRREARDAVEMCRAHGQPIGARLVPVRAGAGAARARSDPGAPAARRGRRGHRAGARPVHPAARSQLVRARVEIELAGSSAGPIAASAIAQVFDELARTSDVASRWQLFAMAGYLLVHRPAADVATVVGIFETRDVENNRRQWLDGVARARAELGDDRFERAGRRPGPP